MHTMAAAEVRGAKDGDVRAPKVKFGQERLPSPGFGQKRPKLHVAAKSTCDTTGLHGTPVGEGESMARPGLVRVFWDERGQMKVLELPSDATARECVDAMALKTCKEDYGDDFEQHLQSYLGQYGDCVLLTRGSKRPLSPESEVVSTNVGEVLEYSLVSKKKMTEEEERKKEIAAGRKVLANLKLELAMINTGDNGHAELLEMVKKQEWKLQAMEKGLGAAPKATKKNARSISGMLNMKYGKEEVRQYFHVDVDGIHFRKQEEGSKFTGTIMLAPPPTVQICPQMASKFWVEALIPGLQQSTMVMFDAETKESAKAWVTAITRSLSAKVEIPQTPPVLRRLDSRGSDSPRISLKSLRRKSSRASPTDGPKGTPRSPSKRPPRTETAAEVPPVVKDVTGPPSDLRPLYSSVPPLDKEELCDAIGGGLTIGLEGDESEQRAVVKSAALLPLVSFVLYSCDRKGEDNIELRSLLLTYYQYTTAEELFKVVLQSYSILSASVKRKKLSISQTDLDERLYNFLETCVLAPGSTNTRGPEVQIHQQALSVGKQLLGKKASDALLDTALEANNIKTLKVQTENVLKESVFEYDSGEIAAQLTLIEAENLRKMQVAEFLDMRWQKDPDSAPHVATSTERFNKVAFWVAHEVLSGESARTQVQTFKKFVRLGQELLKLRNYSTCIQVLSGLGDKSITRLKRFKNLPEKYLTPLNEMYTLFQAVGNYSGYRNLPEQHPSIPFLPVTLRDLVFIHESPIFIDDSEELNVDRMRMTFLAISKLRLESSKASDYSALVKIPKLYDMLQAIPLIDQDSLYTRSLELEPFRSKSRRSNGKSTPGVKAEKESAMSKEEMATSIKELKNEVLLLRIAVSELRGEITEIALASDSSSSEQPWSESADSFTKAHGDPSDGGEFSITPRQEHSAPLLSPRGGASKPPISLSRTSSAPNVSIARAIRRKSDEVGSRRHTSCSGAPVRKKPIPRRDSETVQPAGTRTGDAGGGRRSADSSPTKCGAPGKKTTTVVVNREPGRAARAPPSPVLKKSGVRWDNDVEVDGVDSRHEPTKAASPKAAEQPISLLEVMELVVELQRQMADVQQENAELRKELQSVRTGSGSACSGGSGSATQEPSQRTEELSGSDGEDVFQD